MTRTASHRALADNDAKAVKRGEDMYGYGEQKKTCNLTLTQSTKDRLSELAVEQGISRSELIERWVRREK